MHIMNQLRANHFNEHELHGYGKKNIALAQKVAAKLARWIVVIHIDEELRRPDGAVKIKFRRSDDFANIFNKNRAMIKEKREAKGITIKEKNHHMYEGEIARTGNNTVASKASK